MEDTEVINQWLAQKFHYFKVQGFCAIWNIRPKRILNSNLVKSRLPIIYFTDAKLFWHFAQSTAVLCAKLQNDWTTEADFMDERDFARFKFKMHFGRISHIAQPPSILRSRAQLPSPCNLGAIWKCNGLDNAWRLSVIGPCGIVKFVIWKYPHEMYLIGITALYS